MATDLYKLIYCSRNLIQGSPLERDAEIRQILVAARAYNSRNKITGALLFNAGCFAQVLEGPRDAVEHLFEKIQRDPRHGAVTVLKAGQAAQRDFPDWSMAHIQCESEDGFAGASATLEFALSYPSPTLDKGDLIRMTIMELLRTLVVQETAILSSEAPAILAKAAS